MKHTAWVGGIGVLILCTMCASAAPIDAPGGALGTYLIDGRPEDRPAALAIAKAAQVIFLDYERDRPTDSKEGDAAFILSLKASAAEPMSSCADGKSPPQFRAVFSSLWGKASHMPREDWLLEMKRPLDAGYILKSATIILRPSASVQNESFARSQQVVKDLATRLEAIKPNFGQLQDFGATSVHLGSLKKDQVPQYPGLGYRHDVKTSQRTRAFEPTSKNWCEVRFGIEVINGFGQQESSSGGRSYPLQGIVASCRVLSANKDFDEKFVQLVMESLKPLDALEAELAGNRKDANIKAPTATSEQGQHRGETPPRQ